MSNAISNNQRIIISNLKNNKFDTMKKLSETMTRIKKIPKRFNRLNNPI